MYGIESLVDKNSSKSLYERFAKRAHAAAWRTNSPKKMAAVLVRSGTVLSVGWNKIRSDPKGYWDISIHAELDCLIRAPISSRTKMLIYRFSRKDDSLVSSKPCPRCLGLLQEYKVGSIHYVTAQGALEKLRIR